MRKILLATTMLAALSASANAANFNKAPPPVSQSYPTTSCGVYYGLAVSGSSAVVDGAPAGTVQIGGDVGGLVGYACPSSSIPWFVQANFMFQNLNAGNAGFGLSGPAEIKVIAGVQTPLVSYVSQWLNTGTIPQVTPLLPPGVSVSGAPQNYIALTTTFDDVSAQSGAASFHDWLWTPIGVRTGLLYNLVVSGQPKGNNVVADVFAEYDIESNAMNFGPGGITPSAKMGARAVAGIEFKM